MKGVLFFVYFWGVCWQSELSDLMLATDQFFEEFRLENYHNYNVNDFKTMAKRSFRLNKIHEINKRSTDEYDSLIEDKKGVYLLSDIIDVAKIPAKFPNDINTLSSHNLLFIATLEANGTNPESQLANYMVLYQYSPIHGIKEVGRVPVLGGIKTAIYSFRNTAFIIVAEHEAQSSPDSFQGSTLYKVNHLSGKILLEKIQILNVIEPNDVKFWEHQDEFYLAVGSNMGNDSLRTGTLIYKWMGQHFDCIQHIPSKFVKSVTPFVVESFMYLAIANYQDEFGNTDISSSIYKFHLDDFKFHLVQNIKTHGAQHIAHFKFEDHNLKKSEHFLAVANYIGKSKTGALTSYLDSIIYKFNGDLFIPFQSFKLLGAIKWLPVEGNHGEFLLLVVHAHGLKGYQYDGWRFSQVSLQFGQSLVGSNIQSMRAFQYFDDIFLTIADKNSYGEDINLWKLSFSNRNEVEEQYKDIETWCEAMEGEVQHDNFTDVISGIKVLSEKEMINIKLQVENLKAEVSKVDLSDEIKRLMELTKNLKTMLNDVEGNLEDRKNSLEIPIVMGSKDISNLDIKCFSRNCVTFKNLEVSKMNGEDFSDFLQNVVSIKNDIEEPNLEFERVVIEESLLSPNINDHSAETLVDFASETFINSKLIVNGTVFVNNDLNIYGTIDGVIPDKNHMLLYEGNQNFDNGKLILNNLKVNNIKLSGILNRQKIEKLLKRPEIELRNNFKELNVNNFAIDGLINGYNVTQLIGDIKTKIINQKIRGDLNVRNLDADEVIIESNEINNKTIKDFLLSYYCSQQLSPSAGLLSEKYRSRNSDSPDKYQKNNKFFEEQSIVVVEGMLKTDDITNYNNSASLLNIYKNSLRLNESVVNSFLEFSSIVVTDDFLTEIFNDVPVSTWVLKNSTETQHVYGKKRFFGDFQIQKEVSVQEINGIDLKEQSNNVFQLEEDQEILGGWTFDTLTCNAIDVVFINLRNESFYKINQLIINSSAEAIHLSVKELNVTDNLDHVSWEDAVHNSMFDHNDPALEEKVINGTLRIKNLDLSGRINDLLFDELILLNSNDKRTILLDDDLQLENSLNVEELYFEDNIDFILKPDFMQDWLLQNETQIISVPFTFQNIELMSGSTLKNDTVNNVNLKKLFGRSIKVNENAKIKLLYAIDKIKAQRIDIGGTVNGADFSSVIARSKSNEQQNILGEWLFENGLNINGSLIIEEFISGLNASHLCSVDPSEKINLVVGGSVKFKKEPIIISSVNGINLAQKEKEVWMKNKKTLITGPNIMFENVAFEDKTLLDGYLNNINITNLSKNYLSKSLNRIVNQDYEFDKLVIKKWCRMRKARVDGNVNGFNLSHWANNIILQDLDQFIEGKLKFNIFETSNFNTSKTINEIDLLKDVLRYDMENPVVEGEKTFEGARVFNLSIADGKKIQGVDINYWLNNLVKRDDNCTIIGDVILENAAFYGPVRVMGKVNDIHFDSQNILKTNANQTISGIKHFNISEASDGITSMKNLEFSGLVDGVDLDSFLKEQAYSNRDLIFTQPQTFTKGLSVNSMKVEGLFQGVNVSKMCDHVFNPIGVDELKDGYHKLMNRTKSLIEIVKGRAFFFDYLESIQTLKPNIKAVVPTYENGEHYLAVFTPKIMKLLSWNEYSESFLNAGEGLELKDNITFVTSEVSQNSSLLYMEGAKSTKIITSEFLQEVETSDTSCIVSFQLKSLNKSCIFIGHKENSSKILCSSFITKDLGTYQWLESKGSVQATALSIKDDIYLAIINKEIIDDKIENSLVIYRFDPKLQHFYETHTLAEVNPVAVSSVTYKGNHYLVSAGGHLPESVHNSVISIFRFNKNYKFFVRFKSIQLDTPVDVHFAVLPSGELALYVLTSNPTKPLVVFLHRGVAGFVEETSGLSLYPGSRLYSFTDIKNRHFVVISGFEKGQILKAGFKGDKTIS